MAKNQPQQPDPPPVVDLNARRRYEILKDAGLAQGWDSDNPAGKRPKPHPHAIMRALLGQQNGR